MTKITRRQALLVSALSLGLIAQQHQTQPMQAMSKIIGFVRENPEWNITIHPQMRKWMQDADLISGKGNIFYRSEREMIIIYRTEIIHRINRADGTGGITTSYSKEEEALLAIYGVL